MREDYLERFNNHSHEKIGDGLISVKTNDKSEVINYDGKVILSLSKNERCIATKNGFFLILYSKPNGNYYQNFKIVNQEKEKILNFDTNSISVCEKYGFIVYRNVENYNQGIVLNFN